MNPNEIFGNTIQNIYKNVIYPRSIRARALSGEFLPVHREIPDRSLEKGGISQGDERKKKKKKSFGQ